MLVLDKFSEVYEKITVVLNDFSTWLPNLFLRLVLAWEFGEAGWAKLHGKNWFGDIDFPFPFSLLPPDISWGMATFFELAGAIALVFGFATRFFSISLFVLTIVAIASVHWPEQWHTVGELLRGYRIVDEEGDGSGNYKLPFIYMVMFLPLIFAGAGRLSFDHWIKQYINNKKH